MRDFLRGVDDRHSDDKAVDFLNKLPKGTIWYYFFA